MPSRRATILLVLLALALVGCDAASVADDRAVRATDAGTARSATGGRPTVRATAPTGLPALPAGWPARVELGMSSAPGDATAMVATAPFGFRYQYLAGGANTGDGWATWAPDGAFVTDYVAESREAALLPVLTYYMLYQSTPGRDMAEAEGVRANLSNTATMAAYYGDLRRFFERAGVAGGMTVLHVEPDLWAFLQQRADEDDAASVPVAVGSSGVAELAGLPDTASGFAQAVVRLRDRYAPAVLLGYHVSTWGTGEDVLYADPPDDVVRELGARTAAFYRSLDAPFDIAFTDIADRDAAFKEAQYGDGGAAWMDAADYRRSAAYLGAFVDGAGIRAVLWQLPYGNTRMRAVDNTWGHYQDNKVETLLDDPDHVALDAYTDAGVVAYLFGPGAGGTTCACDAEGDGVTDPAPINGNDRRSLSADDDGGFFRDLAARYYERGVPRLDR